MYYVFSVDNYNNTVLVNALSKDEFYSKLASGYWGNCQVYDTLPASAEMLCWESGLFVISGDIVNHAYEQMLLSKAKEGEGQEEPD
jgi:hypothetical protein